MNSLEEMTKNLLLLRKTIKQEEEDFDKKISPLKAEKDELQNVIIKELKASGQYSARFRDATVSLSCRRFLQVIDEKKVIEKLAKIGLDKEYTAVSLNDLFHSSFAPELAKEGIKMEGTIINEKEYISIREAKEKKDRRKITAEKISYPKKSENVFD